MQISNCLLTLLHLRLVSRGSRIVSAAAGALHSVALASDGSLFTWGDGGRGQLGHAQLHAMALAGAQNHITLLLPQKIMRLDPGGLSPENRVTAISAGNLHTMALTVGGSILAFGANDNGSLGLGDCDDRWKPTKVCLALEGEERVCIRAVQLACGSGHTVALISRQGCLQVRTTGESTGLSHTSVCLATNYLTQTSLNAFMP